MTSKKDTGTETESTYNTSTDNKLSESQEQAKRSINDILEQTNRNIQRTVDEAIKEIPRFTQAVNQCQEQTIQATKDIADCYLQSHKEIINSLQSAWLPFVENLQNTYWSYWTSPRRVTENYARTVSNIADSSIAASRLVNNTIFANMEAFKTTVQHTRDNVKEFSRINANAARTFENVARNNVIDYFTGSVYQNV